MTEDYLILLKRCSLITGNLMTKATLQAFLSWLLKKINPYLPCLRLLHLPSGRKLFAQALFFARTAGMKTHGRPLWKSFQKKISIFFSICPPRHSPWKRMIKDTVSSLLRFPASAALCSTSIEEDWKTMEKTAIPMTA